MNKSQIVFAGILWLLSSQLSLCGQGAKNDLLTAEVLLKIAADNQALEIFRSQPPKILMLVDAEDSASVVLSRRALSALNDPAMSAKIGFPVVVDRLDIDSLNTVQFADFAAVVPCGISGAERLILAELAIAENVLLAGFNQNSEQVMIAVITEGGQPHPQIHVNWPMLDAAEIPLPVDLLQFFSH